MKFIPHVYAVPFALVTALFLSGCGNIYEAGYWRAPKIDAVIADWDVASAKCEHEAKDKQASLEEKWAAQSAVTSATQMSQQMNYALGRGGYDNFAVGIVGGIIAGIIPAGMDESAKDDHFTHCMKSLGWTENNEQNW